MRQPPVPRPRNRPPTHPLHPTKNPTYSSGGVSTSVEFVTLHLLGKTQAQLRKEITEAYEATSPIARLLRKVRKERICP